MTSTSLTLRCIGRRADTHDVVSWQLAPLAGSLQHGAGHHGNFESAQCRQRSER